MWTISINRYKNSNNALDDQTHVFMICLNWNLYNNTIILIDKVANILIGTKLIKIGSTVFSNGCKWSSPIKFWGKKEPTNIENYVDLQWHLRKVNIRQKHWRWIRNVSLPWFGSSQVPKTANDIQNRLHSVLAKSVFFLNENYGFLEFFGHLIKVWFDSQLQGT